MDILHDSVKVETACERYLSYVADSYKDIERIKEKREEARSAMDMLKAIRYDKIGAPTPMENGDDAIAGCIVRLEEIDAKIAQRAIAYTNAYSEWCEISLKLPAIEAQALEGHYIKGDNWDVVAASLSYSERNIYRIRMDALYDLYELLPQGWQ